MMDGYIGHLRVLRFMYSDGRLYRAFKGVEAHV